MLKTFTMFIHPGWTILPRAMVCSTKAFRILSALAIVWPRRSIELRPVLNGVNATLEARLNGSPRALSWQTMFSGESQKDTYQELIIIKPRRDYSQSFPAPA